ncbi:hypothetical protein FRB95_014138 [Tulasnella sp. JGI-2019a]|nr:hypothetical protein FRB95_014138 [Tulasnella sp. JGI-2019a]
MSSHSSVPTARSFLPDRVRILIIGKANAGKTTILKKICSDTDVPIVRDGHGNIIDIPESMNPTIARGLHDIDHEITYPSRSGLVFHDTRGLEAGSASEIDAILGFIEQRARMEEKDALHVIWYCVSCDDDRPLGPVELQFFSKDKEGVPVIMVFTKYDAIEAKAYGDLRRMGCTRQAARREMPELAERMFQKYFMSRVNVLPYAPRAHARFKDLDKGHSNCAELTRQTITALDKHKHLQELFILASKYELESRLMSVIYKMDILPSKTEMARSLLTWFPHMWAMVRSNMHVARSHCCFVIE